MSSIWNLDDEEAAQGINLNKADEARGLTPRGSSFSRGPDAAKPGGYYAGNDVITENNQRGGWYPGIYGGSMGATVDELNRAHGGLTRAGGLDSAGQANEAELGKLGAGFAAQGLRQDAESARLQGAAAGNYGQQLDVRNNTNEALDRMRNFYQQGPTASVAGAQMGQAAQASMGDRVAAAHGGPGGLRAAMNAPGLNGAQFAGMRAGEESAFRGARLGGMGAIQQGQTGVRSGDINAMNQNFGAANAYGQLGQDYAKTGAGTIGQGMKTAGNYARMGEGAIQNSEQLRQNILSQQLHNDSAMLGAQTAANIEQAKADAQEKAAWIGAAGTAVATVAPWTAPATKAAVNEVGKPKPNPDSDVRAKKNIIPIPGQTAGSYGSGRGPMPPPMPMPIPAPPPMPMGSYGPGMGPPPPPPPGTVDLGNVDDWTGSDIRTKNRIIPMPQNYGVGY